MNVSSTIKPSKSRIINNTLVLSVISILTLSSCAYLEKLTPSEDGGFIGMSSKQKAPADNEKAEAYANTVESMNGALGLSHAYLTEEVQDSIFRLAKLHKSVNDIQNRMQVVAPSVDQLEIMKSEINQLGQKFDKIQIALQQAANAQGQDSLTIPNSDTKWPTTTQQEDRPMQLLKVAPVAPMTAALKQASMAEPSINTPTTDATAPRDSFASQIPQGATGLIDIRVGDHKGKTRLVLDMAKAVDVRFDLDAEENIMVVELPGQSAANITSKTFNKSNLLKGYDVQKSGDNTLVIFMFKKPTEIVETMQLKGNGNSAHRIVFDMMG